MNGRLMRKNMLGTFSAMLRPARMIMNVSREEFAELSGLDPELIADVEEGRRVFTEAHYLAAASVFDNEKYKGADNIYRALVRILTPEEGSEDSGSTGDFVLVRRWFGTFSGDDEALCEDEDEDSGYRLTDSELEDMAAGWKIFADTSAIGDENFPALVTRLEPLLRQADAVISVPQTALDELTEEIGSEDDDDEKLNLSDALKYVERKASEGLIRIRDYDLDGDSVEVINQVFEKNGHEYFFALITQDEDAAEFITKGSSNVKAVHIDDKGDLILWGNHE
ncbi:MAG: hypothetical protein IJS39_16955 [Synergistaceae bacterium]|nr:hypothetical protein [Synergistaceae bacterium]